MLYRDKLVFLLPFFFFSFSLGILSPFVISSFLIIHFLFYPKTKKGVHLRALSLEIVLVSFEIELPFPVGVTLHYPYQHLYMIYMVISILKFFWIFSRFLMCRKLEQKSMLLLTNTIFGQGYFLSRFNEHVMLYQRTSYSEITSSLWLSLRLQVYFKIKMVGR